MKRVAIFVDVQNIYYTTRQSLNAHFDYNAFWRKVTADRQVVKATAFAIDRGDQKQRQFQNILRGIGFEVSSSPSLAEPTVPPRATGMWASRSTCWMLLTVWTAWSWLPETETSICGTSTARTARD